jgi:hypothetical protein
MNRLLRVLGVALSGALVLVLVQVGATWTGGADSLVVRIDGQAPATVDLRQGVTASPFLFGANVFPEAGTTSVDGAASGFMSYAGPVRDGLRSAGVRLLRFPGGDWGEQHVLSYDQLDRYSQLLSQTGAEGMVQAHLAGPAGPDGTLGSLTERANVAGRWVDYLNNPSSDLRADRPGAPYHPVRLWTVGNEPERTVNPDTGKPFTLAEYVDAFVQFSTDMHRNDPAIRVFGPEIGQFRGLGVGPADPEGRMWMEGFIQGVGAYERAHPDLGFNLLDGISFHAYPLDDAATAPPGALMTSADGWTYLLTPLRLLAEEELGRDVPIAVTEINANATAPSPAQGAVALWWADTLGALMNQEVQYAAFFSAQGVSTPHPLLAGDGQATPMLRVMQLLSRFPQEVIPLQAQHDPVSVYAAQDRGRQSVSLLFVAKGSSDEVAQVGPQDQPFGVGPWPRMDVSLAARSITLVTIRRGGGADAYRLQASAADGEAPAPVVHTVCGHKTDALAHDVPC